MEHPEYDIELDESQVENCKRLNELNRQINETNSAIEFLTVHRETCHVEQSIVDELISKNKFTIEDLIRERDELQELIEMEMAA